ncbi:MAG: hypothetical protein JNJ54_25830 [Myxococcaceae bacterium]|nr:hypothetical protein [Myxococcaceae bacterium]
MSVIVVLCLTAEPARGANGPVAGTSCTGPDDCKVLDGTTCSTDGGVSSWPAPKTGPACGCVRGVCHYVWIEPVACTKNSDCALATEPVLYPVKATKKRLRPFRPCKDGEHEAVCDRRTKTCLIRGWEC